MIIENIEEILRKDLHLFLLSEGLLAGYRIEPMLAWGIFFIASAAGDIWMTWLLTKENPKSMVLDHPSEAGFYIID